MSNAKELILEDALEAYIEAERDKILLKIAVYTLFAFNVVLIIMLLFLL